MKGSFLLKVSQREIFNELSNEEAGELIKGIFNYVCDGDSKLNGLLNAVFIPIKNDIDKNEEKYKAICERNRQNGLNGGRPKKSNEAENQEVEEEETQDNPMGIEETQNNPVGSFGKNTHTSYITNHKSYNHNSNIIKDIIDYLNNKTKSKFKCSSKATQTKINARLNEGYELNDFIVVIDKKVKEWTGTEFEKYLCPETLFGTKFEKYLNQKESKKPKTQSDEQWEVLKGVYDGTIKVN